MIADPAAARPLAWRSPSVAVVEVVKPGFGDPFEGRREGRQADPFGGPPGTPGRPVDLLEAGPRPDRLDDCRERPLDGRDEAIPGREAVPGELDGRGEDRRAAQPAMPRVRIGPRADGAGNGDRERPAEREGSDASRPHPLDRPRPEHARIRSAPSGGRRPRPRSARTRRRRNRSQRAGRRRGPRSSRWPHRPHGRPARRIAEAGRGREMVRRDDRPVGAADEGLRHERASARGAGRACRDCRSRRPIPFAACDPCTRSSSGRSPSASATGLTGGLFLFYFAHLERDYGGPPDRRDDARGA